MAKKQEPLKKATLGAVVKTPVKKVMAKKSPYIVDPKEVPGHKYMGVVRGKLKQNTSVSVPQKSPSLAKKK